MHVFLAGSTGVLGRRIVPLLVERGHRVTALTRTPEAFGRLRAAGAAPVLADAYDARALATVIGAAAPDVVMHQLTDLSGGDRAANAELRTRGTRNLVDAASQMGVRRVVAQSIAWAYAPGDGPAAEQVALDLTATGPRRKLVDGVAALEAAVRELPEHVLLRYGLFYGEETWYAPDGLMAARARAGELAVSGDVTSFVHIDDAAAAAVDALTWPAGAVNVCDDDPASALEWVPAFCRAVAAAPPVLPDDLPPCAGWARGADNGHARGELHWTPRFPSWRDGFAAFTTTGAV
jgi:nucleoside-diphosphate-sugar epimerase